MEITTWDGREDLTIECLYPNDRVTLTSEADGGESTALVEEFYFQQATECPQYDSFPEKFRYAVVNDEEHVVNDRYAFGLSIVPNGTSRANDDTGDEDRHLGRISLANEWQHVALYTDRSIEGLEPPVFVIVMVDNVHWEQAPHPDHHDEIEADDEYNWTDSPPEIPIGANAYNVTRNQVAPRTGLNSTEPTDDVFMVFKPGCQRSELLFLEQDAGYANQIYLDEELVVDDTSDPAYENTTFDAPGVDCPGGIAWG